jgi:hypothetical protein
MQDTAQSFATADPIADAANAFLALNAAPIPRDESGKFAPKAPAEPVEQIEPEAEAVEVEATDDSEGQEPEAEAPDEGQPEADTPMPSSWPKEDAETWNALPPSARAIIAEREGQRDAAINQKFQEAANVRKAALAEAQAAAANREKYAAQLEQVLDLIRPAAPDPAHYVNEAGEFNGNQYAWDKAQFDKASETVSALEQQRQAIAAQRAQEAQEGVAAEWRADGQRLAAYPDFAADKAPATFAAIEAYISKAGISPDVLAQAVPAEVEMVWKAMQYDRQQEAKARVAPVAKPATPNLRAGVSTPKAAVVNSQRQQAMKRLEKSGSIEDGAAFFRNSFR